MRSSMEQTIGKVYHGSAMPEVTCRFFSGEEWRRETVSVPGETPLTIFINGQETVTILCTPTRLTHLVLGFLYTEGIIDYMNEVASLRVCDDEPIADVRLNKTDYAEPPRRTLTSGCGSSTNLRTSTQKVNSGLVVTPEEVLSLMRQLYQQQSLFQLGGGIHSSALCDRQQILVTAEDIGRHNTLDKIIGECLMRGQPTRDSILLTTGRISSEMLLKAARIQTPIVVSRGSPTERAITLGNELGITAIGYARGSRLSVFSGEERVSFPSR
ncbi:MAG: formate dehydrogenase accessory sulfurtransferase FdhD [Dehalococcoidales bacterium]|nr:formate dehydrogenase accessory sulfurtransferase FdhD [Dehalococcoidales bacterium]MDP7415855.1 formate dehydrogenase accessory sulfurtransferase FdhD [Dehalococcoidales bacterium]